MTEVGIPREERIRRALDHLRNDTTDEYEHLTWFEPGEFVDPATAKLERDRVFGRVPTIVAHGSEIPRAGDFFTLQMPRNNVIVVRQRDGSVKTLVNQCRHRGAMVEKEEKGRCRLFSCPYHRWSYDTDGTLRTTDVYVVGYSWGSQTWAMISSYVRFGRVICTSGPQAEGFPNADWILKPGPNRTPPDRQFTLLGFVLPYPATTGIDAAPSNVMSMIDTTTKAGWAGPPINVRPGDTGPFKGGQIAMVGSNGQSPGGHTIFCTGGATNGWRPLCQYVFNVK